MVGFEMAVRLLPQTLRLAAEKADKSMKARAEEIRLRLGREPTLVLPEGEKVFCPGHHVSGEELAFVLDRASRSSLHSVQSQIKRGFLTAEGAVRIGICGLAVMGNGVEGMKDFSSLALRIPRQVEGAGGEIMSRLLPRTSSVLILSPPGGGKTTFLRELVRRASGEGHRVSVCDERGELAAVWQGAAQFDLGECTDILTGAPKAEGAMMLLRAMNPEIIAMDEISAEEDIEAVASAANCGCAIYAAAHASGIEQLRKRPLYSKLMDLGIFEKVVVISGRENRQYKVVEL